MGTRSKRPYRKRRRAAAEQETRERITKAAVELHGTVGPANTTVKELAELAGVSRMTVYNHFPTDADLFVACSSHWAAENPFPDPEDWAGTEDPSQRLERALRQLYRWYRAQQTMLANILRDAPLLPALGELMDGLWEGYMDTVVSVLSDGWATAPQDEAVLGVTLRVVVDFNTWRLFDASGLSDDASAELAAEMVAGVPVTAVPSS